MNKIPFTEVDKIVLAHCANLRTTRNRTLFVLLFGTMLAGALIVLKVSGTSTNLIFWLALVYVVISTFDKISLGLSVLAHKQLVLKLVKYMAQQARGESDGSLPLDEAPGDSA